MSVPPSSSSRAPGSTSPRSKRPHSKPSRSKPPYGEALRLAWPASIAASVTPLLGTVDVWALAHSPNPLDVAAVGLGAVIFSLVYWAFGFIRMSVAGLTAQAAGAQDRREERASLARGLGLGLLIGAVLLVMQWPISVLALSLLSAGSAASDTTFAAAEAYFSIRIWGAPFVMGAYGAFGWLTAKGRTDALMVTSLLMTALNAGLDYWFVVGLSWGASGVAFGTLIAEIVGFFIAGLYVLRVLTREGGLAAYWRGIEYLAPAALARTLGVNRDIFIRTALLAFSFAWFVQRGGLFGDVTLAANQVLLQLFLFSGLALDGTAIAAETMVGRAVGDQNHDRAIARLRAAILATFQPAMVAAIAFVILYAIAGDVILGALTPPGPIREIASQHMPWIMISPLIVVAGFQLDGVFIGATKAREMRNGMILSVVIFYPVLWCAPIAFGNHGRWAAFSLYFLLRAATLAWYMRHGVGWLLRDAHV